MLLMLLVFHALCFIFLFFFFFSQKVLCRTRILKTIANLLIDQYYVRKQPQVVTLKGAHSLEFCAMTRPQN